MLLKVLSPMISRCFNPPACAPVPALVLALPAEAPAAAADHAGASPDAVLELMASALLPSSDAAAVLLAAADAHAADPVAFLHSTI